MNALQYEFYRQTSLGESLTDALDTLIRQGAITPQLALRVLQQFDRSVAELLANNVKTKIHVKGRLHSYNYYDDVWTFVLDKPTIKWVDASGTPTTELAERLKVVACNARRPGMAAGE